MEVGGVEKRKKEEDMNEDEEMQRCSVKVRLEVGDNLR